MIKYAIMLILIIAMVDHGNYQIKTGDNSLQGYYEYLKKKYWDKPDNKREP